MKEQVLITGASSGIGYEMSKLLAASGYDLIVIARRKERLEALKVELQAKYGVDVHVVIADLSIPGKAKEIYDNIKSKKLNVTKLVNNAGFGEYGDFTETSLERELEMIQVNIAALVELTKLFSKDMKDRHEGSILNVGSLLSFFPFPYYAIYAATKSFVLSFSEGHTF